MHITQCIATKKGLFNNIVIDFDNEITILYGANDTGKTLLAKSIIDIIWGTFSNTPILTKETWSDYHISIATSFENNSYRFIKNENNHFALTNANINNQEEIFSAKKDEFEKINLNKIVEKSPDFSKENIFKYLSSFDTDIIFNAFFLFSPMSQESNYTINQDILKRIFLNDNFTFSSSYKIIKDGFVERNVNNKFYNNLFSNILHYENEIKETEKKLQIIELQNSKHEKINLEKSIIEKENVQIKESIIELNEKIDLSSKINEKINEYTSIKEKTDFLRDEIEQEKNTQQSFKSMIDNIKQKFTNFDNFIKLKKETLDTIQKAYKAIREVDEKIDDFYTKISIKKSKIRRLIILFFITAASPITAGHFFPKFPISYQTEPLIAGIITSSSFFLMFILALIHMVDNKKKAILKLKNEKKEKEDNLHSILNENKISSIEDSTTEEIYEFLLQYFEEYSSFSEKINEIEEVKKTIKGNNYYKKEKERLKNSLLILGTLSNEIKNMTNQLDYDIDIEEITNFNVNIIISDFEKEIKQFQDKLSKNEEMLKEINIKITDKSNNESNFTKLIEEKNIKTEALEELQNYKKSFELISETFEEAAKERSEKQLNKLILKTSDIFNFLTDNHYLAKLEKNDYLDLICNENCSKITNPSVKHLLLLSIKLALSDFIETSGYNLPLIIDEPAIFMDNNRYKKFIEIIKEYSKKRQVIILTHDNNSYQGIGKFVAL